MPSTPLELIDIHTRHISWNERVKSSNVKEYEKFLKRMSTVVKKRLSGTKPLTEYTTTRLEKLNANIEQDLRDINKKVYEQFKTQAKDLASYEAEFEVKSLEKLVEHSFVLPSTTQLNSAVFNTPLAQIEGVTKGKILESFFKDFDDSVVSKIQGSIISGYYTGLTNSQIVRSIIGTKKMNFMDGDFAKKRRHMEAVVRTGLQHAANQARQETWNNNKDIIKGVLWLATLDTRTTITCQALDQKVFPVDSGPRPPAHVNCRSTTVAQLDDRFSVLSEGRTRVARDPETGEVYSVNAKTQYYDWLKAESPAVQDSIIGPSRGKLLREGGLSSKRFAELQLGKNFEPLTLKQMKALEPLAFDRAGVLKNFTIDELMMMTEDISKMTPAQVATYKKQLAAFNKKVTAAKKRVIAAKKKVTIANKQLSAAKKKKSGVPEARAKVEAAKQKVADLDRELKELTGESVPGTSVVKISDSDILKTKKSLEQSGISLAHKISADTDIQLISAVTSINKEVEEILKVKIGIFSKNKIKDTVQNVSIQITNNSSILNDLKAVGSYSPSRHRILLKSDLPIGSDIKLGRYIVGKNMNDAFRHELGHTVYMNPKGFDQFDKILFTQAVDEIGGLQKLKTTVSTYASTNINEAFAECFSVWSHPKYGSTGIRLPKAIEIALDDMFGVTTKTATTTKTVTKSVSVPRPPVTSKVSIPTMTELLSSDEVTDKYIEYLEDRAKKVVITKKAEDRIRKALSEQQKINIKLKTGVENNLKAKMSALPTAQQESYSEFKKYFKIDSSSDSAEAILIDRWATDSGRTEISQFMQFMAKEEFGLSASSTSDFFKLSDAGIAKKGFDAAKVKEGAKLFLREMYNETQAEFKRQGIKEITLFRGMNLQRDKVGSIINQLESGKIVAKLEGHNFRPLSSFSTSTDIAIHFAGEADDGGIHNVISIKVPVERIISSPVTGYGCRREFEYVVLGSNKTYDNVLSAYKLAPVDLPAGVPSEFLSPKNIFNAFESYANNF
jgi:SPP1 gp7 family putative phage head morphogenesis protein